MPTSTEPAEAADYGPVEALADAERIETAQREDYMQARERLDAHPELAADAIAQRLRTAMPSAPIRARLLAALADYRSAKHAGLLVEHWIASVERGGDAVLARQWVETQGESAARPLLLAIREDSHAIELRQSMLDVAVSVAAPATLIELTALLGRGHPTLHGTLRRGLGKRARLDPSFRADLNAALIGEFDATLAKLRAGPVTADLELHVAGVLSLWAGVSLQGAAELEQRANASLADATLPFVVRIASLRVLARDDAARLAHQQVIAALARAELDASRRDLQSAEILGSEALSMLGAAQARVIVDEVGLLHAVDSPRLMALALTHASLDGAKQDSWLATYASDPWPEVHAQALTRVAAPCSRKLVDSLADRAIGRRDGVDPLVSRRATEALGRCADRRSVDWLAGMLNTSQLSIEERSAAASALLVAQPVEGAQLVGQWLGRAETPVVAALASVISKAAPDLDPEAKSVLKIALCEAIPKQPRVIRDLSAALLVLDPNAQCS